MSETILTLKPGRRKGVILLRKHYDAARHFIISSFDANNELMFEELLNRAIHHDFGESNEIVIWSLLKVKQDLEARGIITIKFIGASPRLQILRLNRRRSVISYGVNK